MTLLQQLTPNVLAERLLYNMDYPFPPTSAMAMSRYLIRYYPTSSITMLCEDFFDCMEVLTYEQLIERDDMAFRSEDELLRSPFYGGMIAEEKIIHDSGWYIFDRNRVPWV